MISNGSSTLNESSLKKTVGRGNSRDEDNSYYKEGSGKNGDFNWGVGGRQFRRKWTRDKYKIPRMFEKQ